MISNFTLCTILGDLWLRTCAPDALPEGAWLGEACFRGVEATTNSRGPPTSTLERCLQLHVELVRTWTNGWKLARRRRAQWSIKFVGADNLFPAIPSELWMGGC